MCPLTEYNKHTKHPTSKPWIAGYNYRLCTKIHGIKGIAVHMNSDVKVT